MRLLNLFTNFLPEKIAYAHCDIPCGIYDPYPAQISAHTVLRMTSLIQEADTSDVSHITRLTKVKEEHAEHVKHEVRIIWGDYFKEENYKDLPSLHKKVFNIMKLASKTRQEVNKKAAEDLLSAVQEFSEIFYESKGFTPARIPSGYPTEGEMVAHK